MGDYKMLQVWKEAKDFAVLVYQQTKEGELSKDFGLRDQIRRSVVSIASNIAEGEESGRSLKSINYFYISKGSLAELETQLLIAHEVGYFKEDVYVNFIEKADTIGKMLRKLIQFRESIRQ